MTISSSLNAGVTGLNVNASRLATISDNIANSATYGYKRATADFYSLVLDQSRGAYSAGGVRVTTGRNVDQRGTLITTNNPTDLSIGGRGMIPVTPVTAITGPTGDLPLQMTSTGSFRADANGVLRTSGGQALLGWPANQDGSVPAYPRDTMAGLEPVRIGGNQLKGDATTKISLGVNLPATDAVAGATTPVRQLPVQYFDNLGQGQTLEVVFTPSGVANQWTMVITDNAPGGGVVGDFTVTFDETRAAGGTIDRIDANPGSPSNYVAATGTIVIATQSGDIDLNVGKPGEPRGLSQLSNTYLPSAITKDGSPVGLLAGLDVDAKGRISAVYDSGFTKVIYQIPVIDVPNPNGLKPLANQVYQASSESGAIYLWDAGDGPVGDVVGYAREESATDVASELTQLIQTQRAYSSNAKVIQTVDEMLQETTNIKR